MKITREYLKRVIKEEIERTLDEAYGSSSGNATNLVLDLDALNQIDPKLFQIFSKTGDVTTALNSYAKINAKQVEVTQIYKQSPAKTFSRKGGFVPVSPTSHAAISCSFQDQQALENFRKSWLEELYQKINQYHEKKYDTTGAQSREREEAEQQKKAPNLPPVPQQYKLPPVPKR